MCTIKFVKAYNKIPLISANHVAINRDIKIVILNILKV